MITKKNLKLFLSFLSLVALLLGSCNAKDKLGGETQDSQNQDSQISGEGNGSNGGGFKTNLPIWGKVNIPEEYCGRYTVERSSHINWGNEAYSGYYKDIYWDVKTNAISFTGGKFFPIKSAKYTNGNFHDISYNNALIVTTDFTNGGVMYYLFLKEGNNYYSVRTTNTLGNPTYYITYSHKDK